MNTTVERDRQLDTLLPIVESQKHKLNAWIHL